MEFRGLTTGPPYAGPPGAGGRGRRRRRGLRRGAARPRGPGDGARPATATRLGTAAGGRRRPWSLGDEPTGRAARRSSTTWSSRPGSRRTRRWSGRRSRPGCRSTPSRSWPGGCAARTRRPGSRSPGPTARRPPPRCSRRSCARPGLRTAALGNIGEPLVDAALAPDRFDVLAVELSSFQLHWSSTLAPQAGALLNLADDHLDWHGTFDAYAAAKHGDLAGRRGRRRRRDRQPRRPAAWPRACSGTSVAHGPPAGRGHAGRARRRGSSASSTACWSTAPSPTRRSSWPRPPAVRPAGAHNVSNALHAAALARAFGVSRPPRSRRAGRLRARAAPQRAGGHGRPGSPTSTTARPPTRTPRRLAHGVPADRLGRRRSAQGRRHRRPGRRRSPTGWSGRCCSASTGPQIADGAARDTPRTSPSWRWRGRMMAPWPRW